MKGKSMFGKILNKYWLVLILATLLGTVASTCYSKLTEKILYSESISFDIGVNIAEYGNNFTEEIDILTDKAVFLLQSMDWSDLSAQNNADYDSSEVVTITRFLNASVVTAEINGNNQKNVVSTARLLINTFPQELKRINPEATVKVIGNVSDNPKAIIPNNISRAFLGAMAGFVIPFGVLLFLFFIRNPIISARQLAALTGLPVYAEISRVTSNTSNRVDLNELAACIRYSFEGKLQSVAFVNVTGNRSNDNILSALSDSLVGLGIHATVIDCTKTEAVTYTKGNCKETIGSLEECSASKINELIETAKAQNSIILLNLPRISDHRSVVALARQIDGVLLFVQSDKTTESELGKAQWLLVQTGAKIIGSIISHL